MKKLKQITIGLLTLFSLVVGAIAYNHIVSEEVYLKNRISQAKEEQKQLELDNFNLREILPKKEEQYKKEAKEAELALDAVDRTVKNITDNSNLWKQINRMKKNDEERLNLITEESGKEQEK